MSADDPGYPETIPCPKCGGEMYQMAPSTPDCDADKDHYWCNHCAEVVLFEEYDQERPR